MRPGLVRPNQLLTVPALLGVRLVRSLAAVPARALSAIRRSGGDPDPERPSTRERSRPRVRADVSIYASQLPIPAYDAMNADAASAAIKQLTEPDDVRLVLRYEEENSKRVTVHRAGRVHLETLEDAAAARS